MLLLKSKVKFLKAAYKTITFKEVKLIGPHRIAVVALEETNTVVLNNQLHDHKLRNSEVF
jgi:hypothetical protein